MFEDKVVSLPSHLKTIEPMEVHRGSELCVIQKTSKVISRTDPMIHVTGLNQRSGCLSRPSRLDSMAKVGIKNKASMGFRMPFSDIL